jgi:hypothetical protein
LDGQEQNPRGDWWQSTSYEGKHLVDAIFQPAPARYASNEGN